MHGHGVVCQHGASPWVFQDSTDPRWSSKASMSRRHRFLTTKDGMVVSGWDWWKWVSWISFSPGHQETFLTTGRTCIGSGGYLSCTLMKICKRVTRYWEWQNQTVHGKRCASPIFRNLIRSPQIEKLMNYLYSQVLSSIIHHSPGHHARGPKV